MTKTAVNRRSDRGWTRAIPGILSGGSAAYLHAASAEDHSPAYTGYDPACGYCWLGAPHTLEAHKARTS